MEAIVKTKERKGARMTTLGKLIFSPWLKLYTSLTGREGEIVCDDPIYESEKENSAKKILLFSHQTTLVDFTNKEVIE